MTLTVGRVETWAVLTVTDDGPGIRAAELERAFNRFARLDDARSRDGDEAGGAGLGLTIVWATTHAYGGAPGVRLAGFAFAQACVPWSACLPAAPGEKGGDGDRDEQQGQVGDRQVEQAHRDRARAAVRADPGR